MTLPSPMPTAADDVFVERSQPVTAGREISCAGRFLFVGRAFLKSGLTSF
jgi:hypothetical protein